MNKKLYIALISLLVVAFVASAIYLGSYFLEGKKQEEKFDALSNVLEEARQEHEAELNAAAEPSSEPEAAQTSGGQTLAPGMEASQVDAENLEPENKPKRTRQEAEGGFLPGMKQLFERNDHLVGWIKIDGSPIDYPVMQTRVDNKDFYLNKDFDKQPSVRGTLYVREECDVYKPTDNVTIYGHNMKDGSMFAYLGNYYEKDVWRNNSLIFFDTLFESHVYKIFAVFKTSANKGQGFDYHLMEDADSEADFNNFIATCKNLAFYDTGITPVYGDKIICLSTCEYTLDNGRFVVAAVRIS